MLRRRPHSDRPTGTTMAAALALLLAAAAVFAWYRFRAGTEAAAPTEAPAVADPAPATPSIERPDVPSLVLPELRASDAFVRDLVARLSAHPRLAAWLVNDELVRRFVAAVANTAQGLSPAPQLPFLAPAGPFRTREDGARRVIDEAAYRRYDVLTEVFVSLDTQGAARLYRQLLPLFEEAYAELGYADPTFEAATARAIARLRAVPVPDRPPAVVPHPEVATAWAYEAAELEGRPSAEKHLLRMGPANARRVQTKLTELGAAAGVR
jgi:hypothetical protein